MTVITNVTARAGNWAADLVVAAPGSKVGPEIA